MLRPDAPRARGLLRNSQEMANHSLWLFVHPSWGALYSLPVPSPSPEMGREGAKPRDFMGASMGLGAEPVLLEAEW